MAMEIDQKASASRKRCCSWGSQDNDGDIDMLPTSIKRVCLTETHIEKVLHAHFDASSKIWRHCIVSKTEAGATLVPSCHTTYWEALKNDQSIRSLVIHTTNIGAVGFILGTLSNDIRRLVTMLVLDVNHSSELRRLSIAAFQCDNLQDVILVPHGNAQLAHHVTREGLMAVLLDGCGYLPRHLKKMSQGDCATVCHHRTLLDTHPRWEDADAFTMQTWYSSNAVK